MNLMLHLPAEPVTPPIDYKQPLLLAGSCFADRIGERLRSAKFQVQVNPSGIAYDPFTMARHLTDWVEQRVYTDADLLQRGDLWLSWFHHSDFAALSPEELLRTLHDQIKETHSHIRSCSHVFLTLGTSWYYRHKSLDATVANCHKQPAVQFEKSLAGIEVMEAVLKDALVQLKALNPKVSIVITVSPVKHIRDGIVENMHSKARLLEVAHRLEASGLCSYFPAYEYVTEVLRDYRFYAEDLAHPNELAVKYVFEQVCTAFMSAETRQVMEEILAVQRGLAHRPLHPQSQSHARFTATLLQSIEQLQRQLPEVKWDEELAYLRKS